MKKLKFGLLGVLFLVTVCHASFAATYTSAAAGAWTTSTNWSPNGVPTASDIIIINHAMTLAGTTFTGWTGGTSVTINNGGKLTISGAMILEGSGVNFIINTGGTLETDNNLTLNNQSRITLQGGTLKPGSLTLPDFASSQIAYTSGTLTLTGSLFIGSGETFAYSSALSIPGNVTIKNGSTYTASSLGGTITLAGASKLNLTGGTLTPSSISISDSNTELNINGASVTYNSALNIQNSSKLTVTSGSLTVNNSLTIDGGIFNSSTGTTISSTSLTVSNSGSTQFTNAGSFSISGNVAANGTVTNNGTMNIGGNYNVGGGGSSITNQNGTMNISGSIDLPSASKFYVNPGAVTTVTLDVTTRANENLVVGTDPNPPPYADMIIKRNLISQGSGDVKVDTNGRLAVFGNYSSDASGGTSFTLDSGGKVFINGTISFAGGGDHLTNNNTGVPYGFYSNNQPTYAPSSGSSSNGAAGSNSVQNVSTMQTDAPGFYSWVASISGSPLPVSLLFFKVLDQNGTSVELAWATTTELNFDYFLLERSVDGVAFEEVARVNGHGNSKKRHDYSFVDSQPVNGKLYYRLTSVDFDGFTETFDVVSTSFTAQKTVSVSPNPVTDSRIQVDLNFAPDPNSKMIITDLSGMVIGSHGIAGLHNEFSIYLNSGTYLLTFFSGEMKQVVRIVVK